MVFHHRFPQDTPDGVCDIFIAVDFATEASSVCPLTIIHLKITGVSFIGLWTNRFLFAAFKSLLRFDF